MKSIALLEWKKTSACKLSLLACYWCCYTLLRVNLVCHKHIYFTWDKTPEWSLQQLGFLSLHLIFTLVWKLEKIKSCHSFITLFELEGCCIWRSYHLMVQLMGKFWRKSWSLRGIWLPPSIICTVSNCEAHHLSSVSFASSTPALPVYAFTFFISCLSWQGRNVDFSF